ncbi:signal peptidase I [Haloplasma contractile]|uniref:Signal peptidase I n=1 Tax=Haloplasma contractile SSD-17B TaxID=1033810 RepID=F7PTL1_9MOLU|nr:signal peptidase I [Haloplasma contractile]ERJ12172.1 Signal peptidase I T protein [Haloplasma contractile SSD-17B]
MKRLLNYSVLIIIYLMVNSLILPKHLLTPAYLCGNSNYPTNEYHTFIVSAYPSNLRRGDFVMLNILRDRNEKTIYKRIIGLPGERVEMKDGIVYINHEPYVENYIVYKEKPAYINDDLDWDFTFDFIMERSNLEGDVIPEGYYLVMGDNRHKSSDSRIYGLINKDQIIGKKLIKVLEFKDDSNSSIGKKAKRLVERFISMT